jgi:hypothetical protein
MAEGCYSFLSTNVRVDARRAPRRQPAGQRRDEHDRAYDPHDRRCVAWLNAEQKRRQKLAS